MKAWLQLVLLEATLRGARGLASQAVLGSCPGDLEVTGLGWVSLIPTGWVPEGWVPPPSSEAASNASESRRLGLWWSDAEAEAMMLPQGNFSPAAVKVDQGHTVRTGLDGRSYFAELGACDGTYSNEKYLALNLLGKTMRFTTDLAGAGCGCNVAFYLLPLKHNRHKSECFDYYCDANDVCGESCAEIDIMEANLYAFHSTLHTQFDHDGFGRGFGGGDGFDGPRDWDADQFAPNSACIDTLRPFQTAVSFPTDGEGMLVAMELMISQEGRDCKLYVRLSEYNGMAVLSRVLRDGVTPVISYWASDKMLWLDGEGEDGKGHCKTDEPEKCPAETKLYDFSVQDSVMDFPERFRNRHSKAKAHKQAHASPAAKPVKEECPGDIDFAGYGKVSLVPTGWAGSDSGASAIEVLPNGTVVPYLGSRAYFADSCTAGTYDRSQYLKLNLLGHKMRYRVDLSGAGCGCNAALYLVSMRQNEQESTCGDYYCDANSVCGVPCAEIDLQEANQQAWHSTMHNKYDHEGQCVGFGGGDGWNGPRNFEQSQYGRSAKCIDTNKPFNVEVSFPVDSMGILVAMEVVLTQEGRACPVEATLRKYKHGMAEISEVLAAGMTPVVTYWGSEKLLWLDGQGIDGEGPCETDTPGQCAESVRFDDFSLEKLPEAPRAAPTEGVCVDDWVLQPECVLNFEYKGKSVFGCTRDGAKNARWCSHGAVYSGDYSFCQPCEVNLGGKNQRTVSRAINPAWSPRSPTAGATAAAQAKWNGQCGGLTWNGPKECPKGSVCQFMNNWFSMCSPPVASGGCYSGWRPDAGCKVEFVFDDTEFHGCSTAGNDGRGWCSLDAVYQGRAVNCTQCQMSYTRQSDQGLHDATVHVLRKDSEHGGALELSEGRFSATTLAVGKFGALLAAGALVLATSIKVFARSRSLLDADVAEKGLLLRSELRRSELRRVTRDVEAA